jgi:quinone-modifying oxidoreductase subunit QmoC
MATAEWIEPDLDFKKAILGLGAHDLTACYQCGTCSVVCPISTEDEPFPRKEMVWVQWGLKDRLMADPTVWMCHQCAICDSYCPRDAKPADVMAAVRDYSVRHYAMPHFMGQAVNDPKFLPFLFAFPALILITALAVMGHLSRLPEGPIVFSKFLPVPVVESIFVLFVGFAIVAAIAGGVRYWKAIGKYRAENDRLTPPKGLLATLSDIFVHRKFKRCEEDRAGSRATHKEHLYATHAMIFYGFLGLVLTTTSVGIGIYAFGYLTPWPVWHPVKILGNVSGIGVIAASMVFLYRRLKDEKAGKSTYSDWLFLTILALTTITGFMSEIIRLANIPALAYWTYFIHLILIFFLLVYLPYSKFAHLAYRFVAMLYSASRA